jgi:hypothetical protein
MFSNKKQLLCSNNLSFFCIGHPEVFWDTKEENRCRQTQLVLIINISI